MDDFPTESEISSPDENCAPRGVGSSIITVLVGEKQQPISVHEELLLGDGDFFKAALSHDWKEKRDRTIALPDHHPAIFTIYAKWLYSGQICVIDKQEETKATAPGLSWDSIAEWVALKQSYILSDYLQSMDYRDAVLDAVVEMMIERNEFPGAIIEMIYSHTTDNPPHRKVVHEAMLYTWTTEQYQQLGGLDLSKEDILDSLIVIATRPKRNYMYHDSVQEAFRYQDPCVYHEHTLSGAACYKAKYNR
ncbi:hypothetical protein K491DRAFT_675030 [Lophiostoma macrostomum CBS 122681]|uniref:BTB domain-containing protein n=1 Tax=Lophiostoma macrostomum CBS 122681 TaxID=1314788 RepID=A0A6A6TL12_9PLEO|nr:hypothetical protein K491DRAFT_675030 [Lophiostoma macrostomum CBS 122681]